MKLKKSEKEPIVISLGGSILIKDTTMPAREDIIYISSVANMLAELSGKYKLFIVTGGGKIARLYINLGRSFGLNETFLDELGIDATRLNARLMVGIFESLNVNVYPRVITDYNDAAHLGNSYNIVLLGGTHPGHTTDAVSVMLAHRVNAVRIVNATAVDGIYTTDPNKDKNAKRIDKMTISELLNLIKDYEQKAGPNIIFDGLATKLLNRRPVPLYVINGRDIRQFRNAIEGKNVNGSIVVGSRQ